MSIFTLRYNLTDLFFLKMVSSKYLVSKDKGNYVRTPESYKNLVGSKFKIEVSIISDFLRVPYDHYFMKIKKDV